MAIPTGGRSLDIKARLNAKMREMIRSVSGLDEAEMKWTRPESMVQAYGIKVVGWPTEETAEEGKGPVPIRNPSNNSANQNRYLLELVDNGTLRVVKATREDKEAFADSFSHGMVGSSLSSHRNPSSHVGQGVTEAQEEQSPSGSAGKQMQRNGETILAGSTPGRAGRSRSMAMDHVEQEHHESDNNILLSYPEHGNETLGASPADGSEHHGEGAIGPTTLQEGIDQTDAAIHDARLETRGGHHHHPQSSDHRATATQSPQSDYHALLSGVEESEDNNSKGLGSSDRLHSSRPARIRALALNPDKDGLPKPRPKSLLMLRPDGTIVPTNQRQLRAAAKKKGIAIEDTFSQDTDGDKDKAVAGSSVHDLHQQDESEAQEGLVDVDVDGTEEAVIRALGEAARADAASASDGHGSGDTAATMFLRDGDEVLAMMGGDSAPMMRLMQQEAQRQSQQHQQQQQASASSSSSPTTRSASTQQQGGMGTYGPPPGTTHGPHMSLMMQQQMRLQQSENPQSDMTPPQGHDHILELYQVTGPDFGTTASATVDGMEPQQEPSKDRDEDALVTSGAADARRSSVTETSGHPDQQQLFTQMLNPYTLTAQQLENYQRGPVDEVVRGQEEMEVDDEPRGGEIDVEEEMDAIGDFADQMTGSERAQSHL